MARNRDTSEVMLWMEDGDKNVKSDSVRHCTLYVIRSMHNVPHVIHRNELPLCFGMEELVTHVYEVGLVDKDVKQG